MDADRPIKLGGRVMARPVGMTLNFRKSKSHLHNQIDSPESVLRRVTFSNRSVGILHVSVAHSLHEHINLVLALFLLFQGVYNPLADEVREQLIQRRIT
jgi:hypothetical protein